MGKSTSWSFFFLPLQNGEKKRGFMEIRAEQGASSEMVAWGLALLHEVHFVVQRTFNANGCWCKCVYVCVCTCVLEVTEWKGIRGREE